MARNMTMNANIFPYLLDMYISSLFLSKYIYSSTVLAFIFELL